MPTKRNVLITGASGGVGAALTQALDEGGWRVFAGVRSPEAAASVEALGADVSAVELDITDEDSIRWARRGAAGDAPPPSPGAPRPSADEHHGPQARGL
jgi:NAD(P)-dependent dehydrogenase (short-subunit alcohol dehydrogenase family)